MAELFGPYEITYDRLHVNRPGVERVMTAQGHTNIVWDEAGFAGYPRATCERGCTTLIIPGVHSYGSGLRRCPAEPEANDA